MPRDVLITPATGLVDFKDDSGNVDAYIQLDTSGNLNINNAGGNLIVGNTSSNVYIGNGVASTDIIFEQNGAIRALTGKTLTLGQSDSNITIASADTTVNGNLLVSNLEPNLKMNFVGQTTTNVGLRVLNDGTVSFEGTAGQLFSVSNSMSGTIFSVNDISGIPSIEVLDTGLIELNQYNGQTVIGGSAAVGTSMLTIRPRLTTSEGLTIKGLASQSADLLTVQNSSDVELLKVDNNGNVYANPRLFVGTTSYAGAHRLFVVGGVTTEVTSVIKAVASQTADLTQWQNSAGTVLAGVSAAGFGFYGLTGATAGQLSVQSSSATVPTIILRGAASQSANLQEWQNSAASVLMSVSPLGQISTTAGINATGSWANSLGGAGISSVILGVHTNGASNVGVVVRGSASQSADLQQWQNNSGTVLARIDSIGRIRLDNASAANNTRTVFFTAASGADATLGALFSEFGANPSATGASRYTYFGNGDASAYRNFVFYPASTGTDGRVGINEVSPGAKLHITMPAASSIGLIIKGAASQTANLQEWRNSANTILASVNSSGQFVGDGSQLTGLPNEIMIIMGAY